MAEVIAMNDKAMELGKANKNQEAADIIINQVIASRRSCLKAENFSGAQTTLAAEAAAGAVDSASAGRLLMLIISGVA
jgi:hypothetical protein